jgi:hypothetical protein
MSEALAIVLGIAGFVLMPAGIMGWIIFSGRKLSGGLAAGVAELTPTRTLAEAVVRDGASVELRARAAQGAHKVWLECDVSSNSRWSATATLIYRVSAGGSGYRDGSPGFETSEADVSFGDDGEGISTLGAVSLPRTGALGIPRGGNTWLQLVTLPACPEGSEIFVRVGIADLTSTQRAVFRVFVGVSVA